MYPTVSKPRMRSAQPSDADHLIDLTSMPHLAEMAVWSGVSAGNDEPSERIEHRTRTTRPGMRRTLLEDLDEHAANVDDPLDPWPSSYALPSTYTLYQAARARRAVVVAALVRRGLHIARDAIRRAWERYRRHRDSRAIYGALSALDDRTLRDLGFHRCEIWSVAAEVTGQAENTRVRALPRPPA